MMEPEFVRYLANIVPGAILQMGDRYQINHSNSDVSTLWIRQEELTVPSQLHGLETIYSIFDGADLFSSTFKIASIRDSKTLNGVEITPSLAELASMAAAEPSLAGVALTPFMSEAGVWLYLFDPYSNVIHKWNLEEHEECDSYSSINDVIEEWVRVVLNSNNP